jgi:hypothetical protein
MFTEMECFTFPLDVLIELCLPLLQILMSSKDGGVGGGRGVGGGHQPAGATGRGEGPRRWASEEPVLQQSETRTNPSPDSGKLWRSTEQQQPHRSDLSQAQPLQDTADMATTRYSRAVSLTTGA